MVTNATQANKTEGDTVRIETKGASGARVRKKQGGSKRRKKFSAGYIRARGQSSVSSQIEQRHVQEIGMTEEVWKGRTVILSRGVGS